MKRVIPIICFCLMALLATSSCALAFIGAGAYAGSKVYDKRNQKKVLDYPYDVTLKATYAALEELCFKFWDDCDDCEGDCHTKIVVYQGNRDDVTVELMGIGESQTSVSLQVDIFGEDDTAETIMEEIINQAELIRAN